MCHRMLPLLATELQSALDDLHETGHARIPARDPELKVPDAYPGKEVSLYVPNDTGDLEVATLTWGFNTTVRNASKLVFNTRIETALSQANSGRGLWARPILHGRCLVPVRGFFETFTKSSEKRRPDVLFSMTRHPVFLLAGVWQDERFSVVTTQPNACVGAFHTRMPLVLGPGESSIWLGPDFASLADRSSLHLDARVQE